MQLIDIGKTLNFDEENHIYTDKIGRILTSVTQFLSLFKEKFDPTGIIAFKCGQKEGLTKEQMQAKWTENNKIACDLGHRIHSRIENYIKTGLIENNEDKDIVEEFAKIKIKGKIHSELRLKSDVYRLAGTCDIAVLNKKKVTIHDIKSNKRFDVKSRYNKYLLYPLDYIPDSHLHVYSLQILIYGEMVKEHGFQFEPGQILWVNPETRKIEKYEVLDLKKEVDLLLEHSKF